MDGLKITIEKISGSRYVRMVVAVTDDEKYEMITMPEVATALKNAYELRRAALTECAGWRRQDEALCKNHASIFTVRDGLAHVPMTVEVANSIEAHDAARRAAGEIA